MIETETMITLRRGAERCHDRTPEQDLWRTFDVARQGPATGGGFGILESLEEGRLATGARVRWHGHGAAEIVTYVRKGSLGYDDSAGTSGLIEAGEFQRATVQPGGHLDARNASPTAAAHVFRLRLLPVETDTVTAAEKKRFSVAQRRGGLCAVASPDSRGGSLRLHQDALIFSALLDSGQHVAYRLASGRSAWLHLVEGEAALGDVVLTTGDSAGIRAEYAVSLTAREETEILLLDLGELSPRGMVCDPAYPVYPAYPATQA